MEQEKPITNAIIRIKVVGVGGGGNSVLLRLAKDQMPGVELIAVNTDAKQLSLLQAAGVQTIQIGKNLTKGRGTGGAAELGEQAAAMEESALLAAVRDADLVFVTCGMGGGVGTGAAPVIARLVHRLGILAVGIVTAPFSFEGRRKQRIASEGIARLQSSLDALIVIHNDNLMKILNNRRMPLVEAFQEADGVLRQAIRCISEVILMSGIINVDFADVTTILRQSPSSDAILGIGISEKGRAVEAVRNAIESPLIERSLEGCRGIILNISGDEQLSLYEVNDASRYIYEHTHPDVNIILGTVIEKGLGDCVRATLVATDFIDSVVTREALLDSRRLGRAMAQAAPDTEEDESEKAEPSKPPARKPVGIDELTVPNFMGKKSAGDFPVFSLDGKGRPPEN
ncbi:MAG: cell division protein FtsZ [Schwartzia sp.]|nr:cell division protein FtsZ [Schwartzia sp. (in: firmicutes)]